MIFAILARLKRQAATKIILQSFSAVSGADAADTQEGFGVLYFVLTNCTHECLKRSSVLVPMYHFPRQLN